jgi:hypothetical protein
MNLVAGVSKSDSGTGSSQVNERNVLLVDHGSDVAGMAGRGDGRATAVSIGLEF